MVLIVWDGLYDWLRFQIMADWSKYKPCLNSWLLKVDELINSKNARQYAKSGSITNNATIKITLDSIYK